MNKLINQILYHTHDKWDTEIKYRNELIHFLEFCYEYDSIRTESLLKDILYRVEEKKHLLLTKGLILEFNKHYPEMTSNYFIVYRNSNLLNKF